MIILKKIDVKIKRINNVYSNSIKVYVIIII